LRVKQAIVFSATPKLFFGWAAKKGRKKKVKKVIFEPSPRSEK